MPLIQHLLALNAYLKMKSQKISDIVGSVTQPGREGSILVFAVEHSIESLRDPQTDLPTGKRMHKPLVISKQVDKSSSLLYQMLVDNDTTTEW
jgi:type VI secretion system secreted protein Hcp